MAPLPTDDQNKTGIDKSQKPCTLHTLSSIKEIDQNVWNALAIPSEENYNPFISHEFLLLLEESGSIQPETGWMPYHLILKTDDTIVGVAPSYLKGHSQGEYIFDHHWADAFHRAGGQYFPKLLIASPFTPVPGPRLLCKSEDYQKTFATAIKQLTHEMKLSSAHINFITKGEYKTLKDMSFLMRLGEQFHWKNRGYDCFDDFLGELASRKRKTIRKERRKALEDGIEIHHINGADIKEHHWDAFWIFYNDTGARKWGSPYLTRNAFSLLSQKMAKDIILVFAYHEGDSEPIAGALHFLGGNSLYGRYWGCRENANFLHFECCYYQAIDIAIEQRLSTIEAGAQGHHKLARGYEPTPTYSAHWIDDPSFRDAISRYLQQERLEINQEIEYLKEITPFKKSN